MKFHSYCVLCLIVILVTNLYSTNLRETVPVARNLTMQVHSQAFKKETQRGQEAVRLPDNLLERDGATTAKLWCRSVEDQASGVTRLPCVH